MTRDNKQLSFLDGEYLNPDYVVQFGLFCCICGCALSSRVKTLYCIAGKPQKRLCKRCYKVYGQTFVFEKRVVKEGCRE